MCGTRRWWLLVTLAACAAPANAVVGGDEAALPEPDAAVVFVQQHGRSARLEGIKDDKLGYYSFVGIRYAEPPLGYRRFQRPERRYLVGDLIANRRCLPCPQANPYKPGEMIGQEDCLCLNVYAPKMPGEQAGSPVVFFIHGGNYQSGSASQYGGQHLTKKDTVLVTVQYRLGSLGFLSTGEKDASGNAGLFDVRSALEWVRDYIEFFGGNPTRVVVMGHGSGGSAASLMALSSEGQSIKGVAAMSGTPLSSSAVRTDPGQHAKQISSRTDCPPAPAERLLNCLKELPVQAIVKADQDMNVKIDPIAFLNEASGRTGAGARVEGPDDRRGLPPMVTETPADSLKLKKQKVPLLTGVTSAETSRLVYGKKYSQFLINQFKNVRNFIKNNIVGGLRNITQSIFGLVPVMQLQDQLPFRLEDIYQKASDASENGLDLIIEATGDALFNLPAYESLKSWNTAAQAYLYSFEYTGNLPKGSHFLPGFILTGLDSPEDKSLPKSRKNGPAHGDELAYIFEPLDQQGNAMSGNISTMDANVRDSFTNLIAKFAHEPELTQKTDILNLGGLLPFSEDNDQFIKIADKISLDKNFRYCEMGLWSNNIARLNSAFCFKTLTDILNKPLSPISTITLKPIINGPFSFPSGGFFDGK